MRCRATSGGRRKEHSGCSRVIHFIPHSVSAGSRAGPGCGRRGSASTSGHWGCATATGSRGSPKFQVVIPLAVRRSLGLRPGEKVQVFRYGNRIELIPVRPIREMKGFRRGIGTTVPRDRDRV